MADGLHIPGAMLGLGPRPWEATEDAGLTETSTTDGDSSVLRREFLRVGTTAAAGALVGGPPRRRVDAGRARVGSTTIDALRDNLARLRRLDDHLGGADTFPLYQAESESIGSLIKSGSFSGTIRTEMQAVFAEHSQQAGWAAFDAGWHHRARHLFEQSFDAAKEARNADLAANALALRSYQLLSNNTVAPELTDKSLAVAARAEHPAVKSLLFQRGAWTYALAGNVDRTAWALGQATQALAESVLEPAPDWATWAHQPVELEIMTGRCWAELHRPLRAIPALESAMQAYDDSHARDKALYLSWLADSYLDVGEVEESAATLTRSFDLAAQVASSRLRERLDVVLRRLRPYAAVDEVRELLARRPLHPVEVRR